jgi:hypothetical protein
MALLDEISCSIFHVEPGYFEVTHIKWLLLYCHMSLFHTGYVSGPIILRFHSDENTEPDQELGFDITYQQLGTGCIRPLK